MSVVEPARLAVLGIAGSLWLGAMVVLAGGSLLASHSGELLLGDLLTLAAVLAGIGGLTQLLRARRRDLAQISRLRALASRRADQVSMLSHEVRTPLAVIQGSAELLAEEAPGPLLPRQKMFVSRILDNATRTHSLAEQLLMQARLESDQFRMNVTDVDLRALMRTVVQELNPLTGVPIMLHTPGAPVRAHADPALIRIVVNNLIMNAARSAPGSRSIEVRVTAAEDNVLVAVSDGGTGMTENQRDKLFARFASGRPLGNGTGIGLFISQQLIELHGGRIFVDTITGKGTTMMFTVPAVQSRG
jgi:two-component system OmpR family sensor kinase